MTDTTVPTGWTPDASPKPATLPQLQALMLHLQTKTAIPERDEAIAALYNAIDCLQIFTCALEDLDAEADADGNADDYADLKATQESALGRGC